MALGRLWTLFANDVRIEFRGKQFLLTTVTFGILLLFIVGIALDAAERVQTLWSAGLLWLVIFFTIAISMTRHDHKEREFSVGQALLMVPSDASFIYYAKWLSTALFGLVSEIALVTAFFVILNQPMPLHFGWFCLVVAVGTLSLTGVGTFLVSIAANSSMRDLLIPILLFPMTIPLFLAVIRLTAASMDPNITASFVWVEVLVGYLVVFAVMPWLLYELLTEV
jgi:heme exporter protein B